MESKSSLAYYRAGTGDPLLLVHGFPLDHTIWLELVPLLTDLFDLILPDLPGFGGSAAGAGPSRMADMVAGVAGLLDTLGVDKVFLAGHSMGGYVSLAFADAYPERVRGLALVSSQAAADSPERRQGRYDTAATVEEKGPSVVTGSMAAKLSADERVQQFSQQVMDRQGAAGIAAALRAMGDREDLRAALAGFEFPVVLVHGDADELVPVGMAREAAARSSGTRLAELPGVGHMPMLEATEATAEALISLFDNI